jgi:hypothetical protein
VVTARARAVVSSSPAETFDVAVSNLNSSDLFAYKMVAGP